MCVTGMHRSGTSLAARALHLLGVSLGDPEQLMRPGPDNPAGYWELRSVKELDDELLAHLGGAWDQPPVLEPGWEHDDALAPFRERARSVLDEAFARTVPTVAGWKDPRLSLLLPFWRTVTPVATTIVLVRDPDEVAASLARRNRIEAPHAALLWLRYLFAAVANDPGHLLVRHRDFFDDLPSTLSAIARHLDLPAPDADVEAAVREHLDPALRHHVAPAQRAAEHNPLVELAALVWDGGSVDLDAVPGPVAVGLARGWLRAPLDTEALARARAEVVELKERLRKRTRERMAAALHEQAQEHAQDQEQAEGAASPRDASGRPA